MGAPCIKVVSLNNHFRACDHFREILFHLALHASTSMDDSVPGTIPRAVDTDASGAGHVKFNKSDHIPESDHSRILPLISGVSCSMCCVVSCTLRRLTEHSNRRQAHCKFFLCTASFRAPSRERLTTNTFQIGLSPEEEKLKGHTALLPGSELHCH